LYEQEKNESDFNLTFNPTTLYPTNQPKFNYLRMKMKIKLLYKLNKLVGWLVNLLIAI